MQPLRIRPEQMEAFREERRRVVAEQVAERISVRWPLLLAVPAQPIADCVAQSFEWSRRRHVTDRRTLETVAAVFAVYGPPPWTAPFARALADLHLAPSPQ